MFLVRIPECQEALQIVAEFRGDDGTWEISAPSGTDLVVIAETFEAGVREFTTKWRAKW